MTFEDLLKNLTDDQRERVKDIKSPDELFEFAKNEGLEISDEQLEGIAGGNYFTGCLAKHSVYDSCSENLKMFYEICERNYR